MEDRYMRQLSFEPMLHTQLLRNGVNEERKNNQ